MRGSGVAIIKHNSINHTPTKTENFPPLNTLAQ